MAIVFKVLAEDSIDSCSIVLFKAWGYCKRRRKETRVYPQKLAIVWWCRAK